MLRRVTQFRLFLGSPKDVEKQRGVIDKVVARLNVQIGASEGCTIELVQWPKTTLPGGGSDPEKVILRQVGDCSIFVFLFWKRLGSPTKNAQSGTVEEFRYAYEQYNRDRSKHLLVYFSRRPFYPSLADLDEFRRILEFQKELTDKGVCFHDFRTDKDLENDLSLHLTRIILAAKKNGKHGRRKWQGQPLLYKLGDNRDFHEALLRLLGRQLQVGVIFLDFDNFNNFRARNSNKSEEVLGNFVQAISDIVGSRGQMFRYSGDEFAILVPEQPEKEVKDLAEKIRVSIESAGSFDDASVTASIGVGCTPNTEEHRLFSHVYSAMSFAKLTGKNRVVPCPLSNEQWGLLMQFQPRGSS
jgi:diguanylate cyclase (GGDEF)-like protein